MRLTAIEMQGFKSFPEKTKLTFGDGITAVIGPNGSGKSNISDAIRWVLGEMSVKSLRGGRMEDVIFNGTDKRQAANYAAVSIYLDTSEERAALAADAPPPDDFPALTPRARLSDEKEFVITRKYYRSGESEYYINKKQVRLKDVYELFYDTGIGREGYSVIGQGKIAEVLAQKVDERRSIFEEAAGISKFRFRKQEAERKLRDTDLNLARVNDILSEVESRVEPLRAEAENAKKYLTLAKEKKELEITIWLEKTDELKSNLDGGEMTLAASALELELASGELCEIEKEDEEFTNRGYELMRRKSSLEEKAAEATAKSAELSRQNSLFENDAGHNAEKIADGKREAALVSARKTLMSEQLAEIERDLAETLNESERLKSEINSATAERDALLAPGEPTRNKREAAAASAAAASEKLAAALSEAAACRALIAAAEKNGDSFGEQLNQSRERLDGLKSAKDKLGEEEKEAKNEISRLKAAVGELTSKIKKLEYERAESEKSVSSLKVKAAAAEEQRGALLRLERLFEGYSDSVKTLMRQASEGRIKINGAPIDLRGTVASLLSTEGEYVVAIETALGGSVQFIVSGTEADAKAALNYLKTTGGGRVTVLPLDTVKGRKYDVSRIKDCPGFIGIASDLVSCGGEYRNVADDLLGRTVIAEDIEKASIIAKKSGYTVKIVTIDGQIINAGGSYTGGSPQKKVGIFTRSSDIEKLDAEIASINGALTEAQLKYRAAEREISAGGAEINVKNIEIEKLSVGYDTIRSRFAEAAAIYGEEEKKQNGITELFYKGESEKASLTEKLASLEAEAKEYGALKAQAESEAAEAESKLQSMTAGADEIKDKLNSLGMEQVAVNAKANASADKADELKARLAEEDEKLKQIAEEIASLESILRENAATAEANLIKIRGYENEFKIITEEKQSIDIKLEEREKSLPERRSRLKSAQIRREQAFESYTKLETGQKAAREEYDEVVSRLWEEYELTYTSAEEFRLPPGERDKMPTRLNAVKTKIRAMGTINVKAVEEYEEIRSRRDFLKAQTDDLNRARRKLDNEIARLDAAMESTFLETFGRINQTFGIVFAELFGGGSARLELAEPDKPLECGIDIILRLPGKSVKSISLLSGGEQSFAAIALYLSLQEINPSPFCIFDEIEAALDEVNQTRLMDYIRNHCSRTQYILITHRRGTMERADVLYGITMREKGVSEYLRLNLEDLGERINEYIESPAVK